MTPDDDPGWPRGLSIVTLIIPGGARRYMRSRKGDGLVMMRMLMLSFSTAVVLIGAVLVPLRIRGGSVVPWLPVLLALSAVSSALGLVAEKPLNCATDKLLADSYRTRFFLRIAFAESVALVAFVFVFIGAPRWIYYLGAAFTLFRFWTRAAPTRTALARDQEQLDAAGCTRSLVAALRAPPRGGAS